MVKNPPANARDAGDVGSIHGSGRSPGVGNGNPSCILAWKISWIEEPGRWQVTVHGVTESQACICTHIPLEVSSSCACAIYSLT